MFWLRGDRCTAAAHCHVFAMLLSCAAGGPAEVAVTPRAPSLDQVAAEEPAAGALWQPLRSPGRRVWGRLPVRLPEPAQTRQLRLLPLPVRLPEPAQAQQLRLLPLQQRGRPARGPPDGGAPRSTTSARPLRQPRDPAA